MDSASLEHLLRRGDAKVRRQGATHAATRYDEYDGLCSDSNAASCRAGACVYLHSNAAEREKILMKILLLRERNSASNVPHSQAWIRMDSASLEHLLRRATPRRDVCYAVHGPRCDLHGLCSD